MKCKGYKCELEGGVAFTKCKENLTLLLLREQLEFTTPCGKKIRLHIEDETAKQ